MYVSIDLIFSSATSEWCVIEANDRPAGFAISDQFGCAPESVHLPFPSASEAIAKHICARKGKGKIVFVVPQWLEDPSVLVERSQLLQDKRDAIDVIAADFQALRHILGNEISVARADQMAISENCVYTADGAPVGFVYSLSSSLSRQLPHGSTFNSQPLRRLCTDKLVFGKWLATTVPEASIPTFSTALELLDSMQSEKFIIEKPRFGAASVEVTRIPRDQAACRLHRPASQSGIQDYVYQPWIDGDVLVRGDRHEFIYDLKLYLCDRVIVGGFIRQCAASRNGAGHASLLGWLTTTGPKQPISREPQFRNYRRLQAAANDIERGFSLAQKVYRALERATSE